ncbi:MAG: MarR family winged helix-turn-helix transcriptional regulator [Saprospiraceae bacterium]|nr:MarR family winged helix-turn-helix transcriptional regulator [Saprospiraceae bacterium]MDW8228373.1 MarR family winged helix-turn-helix transcriptional regulator [Saprospiraceae bacterium]
MTLKTLRSILCLEIAGSERLVFFTFAITSDRFTYPMSIFNPYAQIDRVEYKIVVALERLSEAFRVLLWEKGKALGLSPIQIQLLLFIRFHPQERCKVTLLAQEFNLTPSTVSEALRTLEQKGLLLRKTDSADTRSHTLALTEDGVAVAAQVADFADVMLPGLTRLSETERAGLLEQLLGLIAHLQHAGVIVPQRMCFACTYYRKTDSGHFCHFIKKHLEVRDLRVDCPEHVPRKPHGD